MSSLIIQDDMSATLFFTPPVSNFWFNSRSVFEMSWSSRNIGRCCLLVEHIPPLVGIVRFCLGLLIF